MSSIILHTWQVLSSLVTAGAVLGGLFWLLRKGLEEYSAKRIDQAKHELELKADKLSIVFEHQKDSFRKVLAAMNQALVAIEDKVEPDGGLWLPECVRANCYDAGKLPAKRRTISWDGASCLYWLSSSRVFLVR
jgi:hypothetical protein